MIPDTMLKQLVTDTASYEGGDEDIGIENDSHET